MLCCPVKNISSESVSAHSCEESLNSCSIVEDEDDEEFSNGLGKELTMSITSEVSFNTMRDSKHAKKKKRR